MSKYHAKKTVVDGITFASRAEAVRYTELRLLERAGKITGLELQPVFVLQDKFVGRGSVKHKAIKYIADFLYYDQEKECTVAEDVKGVKTAVYKLKKKMFLKKYPHIELRET